MIEIKNDKLEKRYLSTEELSGYICKSRWWIYSKIKQREIPFIPMGRGLLFDVKVIDAWMARKSVKVAQQYLL
jgi:excisionase family DNA binding protein